MNNNKKTFLQQFNNAIDRVAYEIENDKYMSNASSYMEIIDALNEICEKGKYEANITDNKASIIIDEEKMFQTIFDFFSSIDKDLYEKVYKILNNEYQNTKVYIYDYYKDDPSLSTYYSIQYTDKNVKMLLPLRRSLRKEEADRIDNEYGEDFYTIDDLYSIVHEVSHLLDIRPEDFNENPSLTRDVLAEVTPGIFERYLTDFLIEKKVFDKNLIKNKIARINNRLLTHANLAKMKLLFLEMKREKGNITEKDIQECINGTTNAEEFKRILNLVAYSDTSIIENKRYAFSEMCSPLIYEKCKKDSNGLKKYLERNMNNESYIGILQEFGICLDNKIKTSQSNESFER